MQKKNVFIPTSLLWYLFIISNIFKHLTCIHFNNRLNFKSLFESKFEELKMFHNFNSNKNKGYTVNMAFQLLVSNLLLCKTDKRSYYIVYENIKLKNALSLQCS